MLNLTNEKLEVLLREGEITRSQYLSIKVNNKISSEGYRKPKRNITMSNSSNDSIYCSNGRLKAYKDSTQEERVREVFDFAQRDTLDIQEFIEIFSKLHKDYIEYRKLGLFKDKEEDGILRHCVQEIAFTNSNKGDKFAVFNKNKVIADKPETFEGLTITIVNS